MVFIQHLQINVIYHINKMKENHMTISTDVKKACNKIQHAFMIQTINKMGAE